jgi:hypothetical protein
VPYRSLAQARKFHSDPKLKKYAGEYDAATRAAGGFKKLPYRVTLPKHVRNQKHGGKLARLLAGGK